MTETSKIALNDVQYVILYVASTEAAVPFYRDTLGMTVTVESPGWIELDAGRVTLALHASEKPLERSTPGQAEVVFNVSDIQGTYDALKRKGVTFPQGLKEVHCTEDSTAYAAPFHDVDHNLLSIYGLVPK
jgi:catechol 2,3-dioxygenase-like lactoylglutathione lyase family enzyme